MTPEHQAELEASMTRKRQAEFEASLAPEHRAQLETLMQLKYMDLSILNTNSQIEREPWSVEVFKKELSEAYPKTKSNFPEALLHAKSMLNFLVCPSEGNRESVIGILYGALAYNFSESKYSLPLIPMETGLQRNIKTPPSSAMVKITDFSSYKAFERSPTQSQDIDITQWYNSMWSKLENKAQQKPAVMYLAYLSLHLLRLSKKSQLSVVSEIQTKFLDKSRKLIKNLDLVERMIPHQKAVESLWAEFSGCCQVTVRPIITILVGRVIDPELPQNVRSLIMSGCLTSLSKVGLGPASWIEKLSILYGEDNSEEIMQTLVTLFTLKEPLANALKFIEERKQEGDNAWPWCRVISSGYCPEQSTQKNKGLCSLLAACCIENEQTVKSIITRGSFSGNFSGTVEQALEFGRLIKTKYSKRQKNVGAFGTY